MDFDRLRFVSERADASETLMSVEIPEKARGSFRSNPDPSPRPSPNPDPEKAGSFHPNLNPNLAPSPSP